MAMWNTTLLFPRNSASFPPMMQARQHFSEGGCYEGHAQAASLAWLGRWEAEVGSNPSKAREAFQAALSIDHEQPDAGDPLSLLSAACFPR